MQPELINIPPSIAAINDYQGLAKAPLPTDIWNYIHSGSADDISKPPAPELRAGDSAIFQQLMAQTPTWQDIEWLSCC